MLDIGFSEILVIFVLALVVLGPEKLPRFTSQLGRWIGRARGMARQFREQLEEEVNLEEARKAHPVTPAPPPSPVVPPLRAAPTAEASQPASVLPRPESEQQIVYPDHYSHAHPTDPLGHFEVPSNEPPAVDPAQQDWVGGVTATEKPAQTPADAGYAPPHERGT